MTVVLKLLEVISTHLQLKKANARWNKCNCPMCVVRGQSRMDDRKRFGITHYQNEIGGNCFNCGFKFKYVDGDNLNKDILEFLNVIGVDKETISSIKIESIKLHYDTPMSVNPRKHATSLVGKFEEIELPAGTLTMAEHIENGTLDQKFVSSLEYLVSRGIFEFDKFYWSPTNTKECKDLTDRLIIPFFNYNTLVGYTARNTLSSFDSKKIPKYHTVKQGNYIYNYTDQIQFGRKHVIVCEGPFDAFSVGGLAVMTNTMSVSAIEQINALKSMQKNVIVCPDREKSGAEMVHTAIKNEWAVSFPEWEAGIKDANEATAKYGRIFTTLSILKGAEYSPTKIEIQWKLFEKELRDARNNLHSGN